MIGNQSLSSLKIDLALCGSIPRSCFRRKNEQTAAISIADRLDPGPTEEASRTASELRSSPQLQNKMSTVCSTLATGLVKCSYTKHPSFVQLSTSISVEPYPNSELPLCHALLIKKESSHIRKYSHITKPSTQTSKSVSDESLSDKSSSFLCGIPPWAVPANGYSRLEVRFPRINHVISQDELILVCTFFTLFTKPINEGNLNQSTINLTKQAVVHIGRSLSNEVVLFHHNSSRRHALVFHHPSGACFIQDCHSAHGTYVNGLKIVGGALTRTKRGSLIRFGGTGAPSFVLRSFATSFDRMLQDLDAIAISFDCVTSQNASALQQQANETGVAFIRSDSGMACVVSSQDAPTAALVLLNTRINASGGMVSLSGRTKILAEDAKSHYEDKIKNNVGQKLSRDYDSFSSTKGVKHTLKSILVPSSIASFDSKNTFRSPQALQSVRKVSFSDDKPAMFYPAAITPDELSSDSETDEEEHIVLMKPVVLMAA